MPLRLKNSLQKVPALRSKYLIGRILSKSQTALTRLAKLRKSQLNLTTDLDTGYTLQLEIPIPEKRFSVIDHRRKLRALFNGNGNYQLHPLNKEFVETHLNLAKGTRDGVIWTLDTVDLLSGHSPLKEQDEEFLITKTLRQNQIRGAFCGRNFENVSLKTGLKSVGMNLLTREAIPSLTKRVAGSMP